MTLSSDRWSQISSLFDELVELDAAQRDGRLAEIAATDAELADEVRALLMADEDISGLLDGDAAAAVPGVLNRESDGMPADGMAGPYRLLRILGEGGMGVVWLAERTDGAYEQQVAVKVLKRGMDTHAILRRFLQERRILARLDHPHIVRLVDGGMTADDRPFYVMDYVKGEAITVHARLRRLGVRDRTALLAEVADAVAYAHTQLIIHRDLKPSNVMVDGQGAPRVLDFGIAKLIEESGEQTRTGTGMRVLSPAYAAPEQILGEAIGTATDVYALGLMLCELLTGQLPRHRRGTTPAQLALGASQEVIDRASTLAAKLDATQLQEVYGQDTDANQLVRKISGDLDLIIATALQREPARRYATAAAFADDLRRWLDRRPIAARADSTAYRFNRFVRRHRAGVAATALVLLALIGGLGAALWQGGIARHQADLARQQAQRAERVKSFLIDIFKQNDPEISKGEPLSAAAILSRGRTELESSLTDDPATRGELLMTIAEIQGNLGQRDEGLATLGKGFPLFAESLQPDDSRLAHAYYVRASLYDLANRPADAEHDLLAARKIIESVANPDDEELDKIDSLLAEAVSHTRGLADAIALRTRLIDRIRRRLGDSHPAVAEYRSYLARMHEENNDYASAEQGYRESLKILRDADGEFAPIVCETENNYAGLLDRLSRSEEALPHFDRSLECREKLFGRDSIPYARTLFSRGILLLNLRRYADAEADLRSIIPVYADRGQDAGNAHRYLGRALMDQHRYVEAAIEFKAAERIYREVDFPHDFQRWRARADYGYAMFRQGNVKTGRAAIQAAMAGLREEMPEADTPEFMRPLRASGEIARFEGDVAAAITTNRRWHELAVKNYGTDSRDAYRAGYELASDLATVGNRSSLLEARTLLVDVVRLGKQFDEPALADYEDRLQAVEAAIGKSAE